MSTSISSLLTERSELTEKYIKLSAFIGTDGFNELEQIHRQLLQQQEGLMGDYLNVLNQRISLLTGE